MAQAANTFAYLIGVVKGLAESTPDKPVTLLMLFEILEEAYNDQTYDLFGDIIKEEIGRSKLANRPITAEEEKLAEAQLDSLNKPNEIEESYLNRQIQIAEEIGIAQHERRLGLGYSNEQRQKM